MDSKFFLVGAIALMVLASGCTEQQPTTGQEPANTDNEIEGNNAPAEETPADEMPIEEAPQEEPETGAPESEKLAEPYRCDDALVVQKFASLGEGFTVSRKPAPFGKTINYVSCNVSQDGEVVMQFELHELNNMEMVLESMEDEARQYQNQIPDLTKEELELGYKTYYFHSENTKEHRMLVADDDRNEKVLIKIKSTPGMEVERRVVEEAAAVLEEMI